MIRALIDTNIILDFFLKREPFYQDACKILSLSENKKIKTYITTLSYSNIYYILRQLESHEIVVGSLTKLSKITEMLNVTSNTIKLALDSDFNDFEDAIQYFACFQNKRINLIITRNVKDYKSSKLIVLTSEDYIKSIQK